MHEDLVKSLRTGYCEHKLLNEAADAIEEMQRCIDGIEADNDSLCAKLEELSKSRWISVMERLPEEENAHVLVWCPRFRNIFLAYVHDGEWRFFGYRGSDKVSDTIYGSITHWRHLPEPPKEEDHV